MTSRFPAVIIASGLLALTACGGGNNVDPQEVFEALAADSRDSDANQIFSDAIELQPTLLSDPVTFDPFAVFPEIIELQRDPESDLLLGYTSSEQFDDPDLAYVNDAWLDMQDCLGVSAHAPLVVLQQDSIEPLASTDDIVIDFEGRLSASANDGGSGASLQVRASEVAATHSDRGFSLRSIMGRYLWRNNDLAERDYPFSCAKLGD